MIHVPAAAERSTKNAAEQTRKKEYKINRATTVREWSTYGWFKGKSGQIKSATPIFGADVLIMMTCHGEALVSAKAKNESTEAIVSPSRSRAAKPNVLYIIVFDANRKKERHYGYRYRPSFLYVVHDYKRGIACFLVPDLCLRR